MKLNLQRHIRLYSGEKNIFDFFKKAIDKPRKIKYNR